MTSFHIKDVKEITIKLHDETEMVYRGSGGIEQVRNFFASSPSLKPRVQPRKPVPKKREKISTHSAPKNREVQQEDSAESSDPVEEEPEVVKRPVVMAAPGGYNTITLNYATPKSNKSPHDMAREMQKAAESSSGIKF